MLNAELNFLIDVYRYFGGTVQRVQAGFIGRFLSSGKMNQNLLVF